MLRRRRLGPIDLGHRQALPRPLCGAQATALQNVAMEPIGRRIFSAAALLALPHAGLRALPADPAAGALRLVNASLPPFVVATRGDRVDGIDIELAHQALAPLHVRIDTQLLPWRRVLQELEQGLADFTTTISRSKERERFLVFSEPYRRRAGFMFFTARTGGPRIARLQDLRGLHLVSAAGFYVPPQLAHAGLASTSRVRDLSTALRMLAAGRVDAALVGDIGGPWAVRELGLRDRLRAQPWRLEVDSPTFMAFSRQRHADGTWVRRMNEGLRRLQRAGRLAELERRYR